MEGQFDLAEGSLPNGGVVEEGELLDGGEVGVGFLLAHGISFF